MRSPCALGLRSPTAADLPLMIEAAAQGAWSTDHGQPIAAAVIAALRTAGITLPNAAVIERAAIAGRARARKRAADALLAGLTEEQTAKLDGLLALDPSVSMTPFAWLKAMPVAPKAGSWPLSMIRQRAGTYDRAGRGRHDHTSGA